MKKWIWLGFLYSLIMGQSFGYVTANVSSQSLSLGEPTTLTISTDESIQSAPDFSILSKDFLIHGVQQSQQIQILNGQSSVIMQWILLLQPKKSGVITIPSFTFNQSKTSPISLTVSSSNLVEKQSSDLNDEGVLKNDPLDSEPSLSVNVDKSTPYVHQQLIYTVKIRSKNNILNSQYEAPSVKDALIFPLGEGSRKSIEDKGEIINMDTFRYAIFPQKSGVFEIHPPALALTIEDGYPKQVYIKGKKLTLTVKPDLKKKARTFMASQVVLMENIVPKPDSNIKAGDVITRKMHLKVVGLPAELVPSLDEFMQKSMAYFLSKPTFKTEFDGKNLVGDIFFTVTYWVKNSQNDFEIPAIHIPWLNVDTGKMRDAFVPAHRYTLSHTQKTVSSHLPLVKGAVSSQEKKVTLHGHNLFIWSAMITMVFVLIGLVYAFSHSIHKMIQRIVFYHKMQTNDPQKIKEALFAYIKIVFPDVTNWQAIDDLFKDTELADTLTTLAGVLYGKSSISINGKQCYKKAISAFKQLSKQQKKTFNRLKDSYHLFKE